MKVKVGLSRKLKVPIIYILGRTYLPHQALILWKRRYFKEIFSNKECARTCSRKYPNGLFIIPYAKCAYKVNLEGHGDKKEFEKHKRTSLYFNQVFRWSGKLLYRWQNIGGTILIVFKRLVQIIETSSVFLRIMLGG